MSEHTIDLVRDFSKRPFGRYESEGGERSADVFRKQHLIPALEEYDRVVVDLSGYNYYGSSFLEEAFGGLVRDGYDPEDLKKRLVVIHRVLPSVEDEARDYIFWLRDRE